MYVSYNSKLNDYMYKHMTYYIYTYYIYRICTELLYKEYDFFITSIRSKCKRKLEIKQNKN